MPLHFIVPVHVMLVPLVPLLGLVKEVGFLLQNVLKGNKPPTRVRTLGHFVINEHS